MPDLDDRLRRLLAARADRVHSELSGPAIRARAEARARRGGARRYGPLVAAIGVLAAAAVNLPLIRPGAHPPATPANAPSVAVTTTPGTVTTAIPVSPSAVPPVGQRPPLSTPSGVSTPRSP
jgi:hypothetical protein